MKRFSGQVDPVERLASKSIVISRDVLVGEAMEPQFKYVLDNLLTPRELRSISSFSCGISDSREDLNKYLEKTKNKQFLRRYSSFSLIPDVEEASKMPRNISRIGALEKILRDEKSRTSLSTMKIMKTRMDYKPISKEMEVFLRIQKKLNNLKQHCPRLYHTEDDIITVWANMMDSNDNIFTYKLS